MERFARLAGFLADGEAQPAESALSARERVVGDVRVGEPPMTTSEICMSIAHAECTLNAGALGGRNA